MKRVIRSERAERPKCFYIPNATDSFMRVKDIMHGVTKIPSGTTITEAARIMDQKLIGSVLIEENKQVTGIVTERDILRKVVARGKNPEEVRAKDIMSYPVVMIDANEDALEASRIMDEKRIRRLAVTENGIIIGKVTANSISRNLKYLLARKSEVHVRPEY